MSITNNNNNSLIDSIPNMEEEARVVDVQPESEDKRIKAAFSPAVSRGTANLAQLAGDKLFKYSVDLASLALKKGLSPAKAKAVKDFKKAKTKVKSAASDIGGFGGTGSGGDVGGFAYKSGNRGYVSKPPVKRIDLTTPIDCNLYQEDALRFGTEGPKVFLQTLHVGITDDSNDFISRYLKEIVYPAFRSESQKDLGFNINAQTILSDENIKGYFNSVIDMLEMYYCMMSIISFSSNYKLTNLSMEKLRDTIEAEDIQELNQLAEKLARVVIPTNLENLIFWMQQTYKLDELTSNSSVVKILPFGFSQPDVGCWKNLDWADRIKTLISNHNSSTNQSVNEMLSRVVYKKGLDWISSNRVAPFDEPIYDHNFKNLWTNAPYIWHNGIGNSFGPVVADSSTAFRFFAFGNSFDGAVAGLTSRFNQDSDVPGPLHLAPSRDTRGYDYTRFYINDSSECPFVAIDQTDRGHFAFSAGLCHVVKHDLSVMRFIQPPGSSVIANATVDNVRVSTQQLYKWMFELT